MYVRGLNFLRRVIAANCKLEEQISLARKSADILGGVYLLPSHPNPSCT